MNLITPDKPYTPLSIYVLDPIEYVALGLNILKMRDGEKKWEQMQRDRFNHPDPQKTVAVAHGAIIYTALFPDRTHKESRPPEDWKLDAGITEATMHEARKQLEIEDPNYEARMAVRKEINRAMDEAFSNPEKQ